MSRKRGPFNFKTDDRIAVTGQPGTGKSVFTMYLATLIPEDRLLIVDPLDQYRQFPDKCRYVPLDVDPEKEFNDLAKQILARGNVTVFVEEAQRYLPQDMSIGRDTMAMLNRRRNYGIGVVPISQRPQHINKNFWDLAQNIVFFRCGLATRDYLRRFITPDAKTAIDHLKDTQFIYYSLRDDTWNKAMLKFPQDRG
jgi:energy-coupling factor transporter ATP-binding protein EcfA2